MSDILTLTQQYLNAFGSKDVAALNTLLADDVALEDPVVSRIEGKVGVLNMMQDMFRDNPQLSFAAKNIYVAGNTGIIEFTLDLGATHLEGVDIIDWKDGKMQELRAYLDIPKP